VSVNVRFRGARCFIVMEHLRLTSNKSIHILSAEGGIRDFDFYLLIFDIPNRQSPV
jgi:hypothetical protein